MTTTSLTISDTLPLPNSSHRIPRLGFGVYRSSASQCVQSCLTALETGYRHIDTAQYYGNEAEVGTSIRSSSTLQRKDVFVTTKILSAAGSVEKTHRRCVESVEKIDTSAGNGYVDLFLIHSPGSSAKARKEMWLALERLLEEGKTKSIGVSNFGIKHIEEMKDYATVWPPQVNQLELHPWCQQREITEYCHRHGIVVEAYAPLVRNYKANDPTLVKVTKKYSGKTTAQILIRYGLQKNWVPLPKSDNPEWIKSNADVYDFEIKDEDMKILDDLDQGDAGAIVEAVQNS